MDEVTHVWLFRIKQASYESLLSNEEKVKADFFKRNTDRERYIFCRGLLRILLAYYLQVEPNNIQIVEVAGGKPEIFPTPKLSFNLSHANEIVAYAFSTIKKVGIDIEYVREVYNIDKMARDTFYSSGLHSFELLPLHEKKMIFFKAWTMREAYFKALGGRLSDYSIDLDDNGDSMVLKIKSRGIELSLPKIIQFKIYDNYLVALALQS